MASNAENVAIWWRHHAFYHCVFSIVSLEIVMICKPSRYSRNRYVFVFSSNIIIGTCKCGYRRAQNSLLSLLNVSLNRFSRWFIVVLPHIFSVVASNFMRRGDWLGKYFLLSFTHLAIKHDWNDWICVSSNHIQKIFWPFPRHITAIISITNL